MSGQPYTITVPAGTTHFFWQGGQQAPLFIKHQPPSNQFMVWGGTEKGWSVLRTLPSIESIYHYTPVTCRLVFEDAPGAIDWHLVPEATHYLPQADDSGMYADSFWRFDPETGKALEAWRVNSNGTITHALRPVCARMADLIARPVGGAPAVPHLTAGGSLEIEGATVVAELAPSSDAPPGLTARQYAMLHAPTPDFGDSRSRLGEGLVGRPRPEWKPYMDGDKEARLAYELAVFQWGVDADVAARARWADALLGAVRAQP